MKAEIETEIERFQNQIVPKLHAWLASLEGSRFETKEEGYVAINEITSVVRRAGRRLMLEDKPVTLSIVETIRQKHVSIHVYGRKDGKRVTLHATTLLPKLTTETGDQ